MDEARYVFNQTSSERKRIGRGAIARKNGSKSKKCGLPSDHLSAAERKKLNGECKTYDLSRPMSWPEFKGMPHDLRSEYIHKLAGMGAGRNDLADMFHVSPNTYSQFMVKNHKGEKLLSTKSTDKRDNDEFIAWFIGEEQPKAENSDRVEEHIPEPEQEISQEKMDAVPSAGLNSGTLSFSGNAKTVFDKILPLLDEKSIYNITVSFSLSALVCAVQN